jgi:hypothetical protein
MVRRKYIFRIDCFIKMLSSPFESPFLTVSRRSKLRLIVGDLEFDFYKSDKYMNQKVLYVYRKYAT